MKEEHAALVDFLDAAKQSVIELDALQRNVNAVEIEGKKCEKALSAERKAVADQVALTVKRRKEEITAAYDRELRNDQEKLRKARARREKAKSRGMKARIEEETAELNEENRQLRTRLTTLFKQNHLPGFCNTSLYYALFLTRSPKDFMILLITILICFLGIPLGIYFALPEGEALHLAVIYLADIIVFVGLYVTIANRTKIDNIGVLREGRKLRMMIGANERKMKAIKNSIEKDRNEDVYDLEKYDDEIQEIEEDLRNIASRKEDALYVFENDTALILTREIKQDYQGRIEELAERKTQYEREYKELSSQLKTMTINVTDEYESRIGREFMSPDKLEALIRIFEEEKADSLSEAQELYRNKLN